MVAAFTSWAQVPDDPEPERNRHHEVIYEGPMTEERPFSDETGEYIIRFTYGMFEGWTATDDPEGQIRYSAFVEVFRVKDGGRSLVGHGFMGIYSPEGCIYDEPDYLITEALKIERRASRQGGGN